MSKASKQQYKVKAPFPYKGEILTRGATVTMHPRAAKYLIGSHLERPEGGNKRGKTRAKRKEVSSDA